MTDFETYLPEQSRGTALQIRNRVLRNTYWLLALSMIPTVLGAWVGIATGINVFMMTSPITSLAIFFIGSFALMFAIQHFRNSGIGVLLLLVFTFFMGVMLSRMIGYVLGFSNGASLIMLAFGGTAVIFAVMATIATVSKRDFSGLSSWLFMGLLLVILASVANIFLKIPALMLTISFLILIICSVYILFDVQRVVNGGETNYVSATLAIYIDLYNVFTSLLSILSMLSGNRN